jgi:Tol biopolymer transport system component
MFRYVAGLGSAALVFLAVACLAMGEAPSGPRLAYATDGQSLSGEELLTTDPLGTRAALLYRHPGAHRTFRHVSWSPDGSRIAFASHGFGLGERIYTVSAEGGSPQEVAGTQLGFAPVFSPDGGAIAFARRLFRERADGAEYWSTSIWLIDARGGEPRQLTPWRDGLILTPSSFSPDGTKLLAERAVERGKRFPEIVSVLVVDGSLSLVVKVGAEPVYSPDGGAIAFIRPRATGRFTPFQRSLVAGGDLFTARPDGSQSTRLTFTPNRREAHPSWDPSGERLAFGQIPAKPTEMAQQGETGSSIMQINADGSCRARLLSTRGIAYREPSWQPGPGRGAGRIPC